jgi:hypothetical protein
MMQFIVLRHQSGNGLFAIPATAVRFIGVTQGADGYLLSVDTVDAWYVARKDSDRESLEKQLEAMVEVLAGGRSVDISKPGAVCPF